MRDDDKVVRMEAAQTALRNHFLGWQCRVRQLCIRDAGGRPTAGMRPTLTVAGQTSAAGQINVLIVKRDSEDTTAQFRHLVRKTHDPAERYEAALRLLAAAYYQRAREFSDQLTALFGPDSATARKLADTGRATLDFEQYNQRYHLPCEVHALSEDSPAYQATYWHNSLFNAALPAGIQVLGFTPDWSQARAQPAPA